MSEFFELLGIVVVTVAAIVFVLVVAGVIDIDLSVDFCEDDE